MIRVVVSALLLLLVIAIVAYLVIERRRRRDARWMLRERSDGRALVLVAERPGERPMLLERVGVDEPDFELRVEEARAEAAGKVVALNNQRGL